MKQNVTRQRIFGSPSCETVAKINDSDAVNAAAAIMFRYNTKMRELEAQFEEKASYLRIAVLDELAAIRSSDGEAA